MERMNPITDFQQKLGYEFNDPNLLRICLTHASAARTRNESNERLEFLGDAILGMIVCEMLWERYPDFDEGELTRVKSVIVSRETCAKISQSFLLEDVLIIGKGLMTHEQIPTSVLAAAVEALIAGIYLEAGWPVVKRVVRLMLEDSISEIVDMEQGQNYKSLLQQYSQKHYAETPQYRLLDEKGPDHSKCFQICAVIGTQAFSPAWGSSKKEAEQRAAQNAISEVEQLDTGQQSVAQSGE